jgi:serine/threonine-protein kinase
MSPEQLKGEQVDGRSDLFSLGVILYWLLTAEKPFSGDGTAVIAKILYQEPPPVTQVNSRLGSEYERVVSKALAKDASARYQRGKEFAEELAQLPIRESAPAQNPLVGTASKKSGAQESAETASLQRTVLLADLPVSPATLEGTGARSGKPLPKVALAVIGLSALFSLTALIVRTINRPAPAAAEPIPTVSKPTITKNKPAGVANRPAPTASKATPSVPALAVRKSSGTANLQILCWHDFSSAELSVWVAGVLVYQSELQVVKKRSGGYLATTVQVPAGKRSVRVQVKSNRGKYDRSRTIDGEFSKDRDATLEITCDEFNGSLLVAWQKLVDP